MALDKKLFKPVEAAAPSGDGTGNQEEGLVMYLDANDVDSYDGDGSVWYDISDHEYTPATDVSEHFNTVLYTGDGTNDSTKSITGVGFQPDFVWIKNRDAASNHYITDVVRGDEKHLYSEANTAENGNTIAAYGGVLLDSDGFTVNKGTNSSSVGTNASNDNYVAWCFKAGGAAVSNTDGSITSQVSANNDLGFSVVTYTGNGSTNQTVGNGLDVPVDLVIVKKRNTTGNWISWHRDVSAGNGKYIYLDLSNALGGPASTPVWDSANTQTNSTAGVFGINNNTNVNTNSHTYVAYCFASKRGVSKVGSYTGSTGSVKVYTGFEPAFVMIKNADVSGDPWVIFDNKRGDNGEYDYLYPSESYVEGAGDSTLNSGRTGITFNRDGFTLDDDDSHSVNESGKKHIYLAFAKNTKETSLHTTDLELHLDPSVSGSVTTSTWSDQAGSNDGTLSGFSSTLDDFYDEELGDSILFDGSNDKVTLPNTFLDSNTTLTLEAWVNVSTFVNFAGIIDKYEGSPTNAGWGMDIKSSTDKKPRIFLYNNASREAVGTTVMQAGKWYHIAGTITSSQIKIYVNGELETTTAISSALNTGTEDVNIGGDGVSTNLFNGKIGQVRIYSSELTQDQIRQNFNFTKNDYPNGYDGTLVSGALPTFSTDHFDFVRGSITGGSDQVVFSSAFHSYLKSTSEGTITAWIKVDAVAGRCSIFATGHTSDNNDWAIFRTTTSRTLHFSINNGGTANGFFTTSTSEITTGSYIHVAMSVNSAGIGKMYINGVSQAVSYQSGSSSQWFSDVGTNTVTIGSFDRGSSGQFYDGFDGEISQVKFYNRVLSDQEISDQHTAGR